MRYTFLLLVSLLVILAGCLVKEEGALPAPARIRIANAVPAHSYSLLGNEQPFAANVPYDSITPYGYALPGFYNMDLKSTSSNQSIAAKQVIQANLYYTFFVIPDSSSTANNISGFKLSVISDDQYPRIRDSFYIRFLHYSPKPPADNAVPSQMFMKTYKERGTSDLFDSIYINRFRRRSFNDISVSTRFTAFEKLEEGSYRFSLFNEIDSSVVQFATTKNYFTENKYYTLYLEGFKGGTGDFAWKIKIDSVPIAF